MADTIRLYPDEDAQQSSLIRALRARQVDVQTAHEAGLVGVPDEVQLAHAAEEKRVILTFNRGDFVKLHIDYLEREQSHAGIIVSDQLPVGVLLRRLLKLLDARDANEMESWLEFLSNWR
jgi:hypothetical protein